MVGHKTIICREIKEIEREGDQIYGKTKEFERDEIDIFRKKCIDCSDECRLSLPLHVW